MKLLTKIFCLFLVSLFPSVPNLSWAQELERIEEVFPGATEKTVGPQVPNVPFHTPNPASASGGATETTLSAFKARMESMMTPLQRIPEMLKQLGQFIVDAFFADAKVNRNLIFQDNIYLDSLTAGNMAAYEAYATARVYADSGTRPEQRELLRKLMAPEVIGKDPFFEYLRGYDEKIYFYNFYTKRIYSKEEDEKTANNYLDYISGLTYLFKPLPSSLFNTEKPEKNAGAVNRYQLAYANFLAANSAGMNYLFTVYNERKKREGLGTKVGMQTPDASIVQVDHYLAERRAVNPAWYANMAVATPNAIAREQVYLLAEIRYELHKMREEIAAHNAANMAIQMYRLHEEMQPILEKLRDEATNPGIK